MAASSSVLPLKGANPGNISWEAACESISRDQLSGTLNRMRLAAWETSLSAKTHRHLAGVQRKSVDSHRLPDDVRRKVIEFLPEPRAFGLAIKKIRQRVGAQMVSIIFDVRIMGGCKPMPLANYADYDEELPLSTRGTLPWPTASKLWDQIREYLVDSGLDAAFEESELKQLWKLPEFEQALKDHPETRGIYLRSDFSVEETAEVLAAGERAGWCNGVDDPEEPVVLCYRKERDDGDEDEDDEDEDGEDEDDEQDYDDHSDGGADEDE